MKLENELKKELFHVDAAVQENVLSGIGCIWNTNEIGQNSLFLEKINKSNKSIYTK